MRSLTTCRSFAGGSGTDRIDFGSAAALDDLHNSAGSGFYGMFVIRPNAIVSNSWIAEKGTLPNGWQFLFDRNAANTADGYIRLLVWRSGGLSDTHASSNQMAANTSYVVAFSWSPSSGGKLFIGGLTGSISEVTYGTQSVSSGTAVSDAASNLIVGNDAAGSTANKGFPGEIERFAIGSGTITAADVQRWRDVPLPAGALVAAYLGQAGGSSETDETGNGNTGTVTGATVGTARDPVYLPETGDFHDTWTAVTYNADTTSEYIDTASYARLRYTVAADSVDVTAYVTNYDSSSGRASMTCVTADRDGAYAGQVAFTTDNAYNRGTIALGGTATTVDILSGPHSRRTANNDGTEPQEGIFPAALRFTASGAAVTPTTVAPSTPTRTEIVVSDSAFGEAYTTDPPGQYNPWLQRRRAHGGLRNVAFASYGGLSVYILAADSTRRADTVSRLNSIPGSKKGIVIELGANDKGITSWTPTQCATALSALITDIQSGVTGLTALVVGVPLAQSAGNEASTNAGGYTVQDYRDAILALAPISGVTFLDSEAWVSAANLNADGIHLANAGATELYGNMTAPLDTALAALGTETLAGSAASAAWTVPAGTVTCVASLSGATATAAWTIPAGTVSATADLSGSTATTAWTVPVGTLTCTATLDGATATATWTAAGGALSVAGAATLDGASASATWTVPAGTFACTATLAGDTATTAWAVAGGALEVAGVATLDGASASTTWTVPAGTTTYTADLSGATATTAWAAAAGLLGVTQALTGASAASAWAVPAGAWSDNGDAHYMPPRRSARVPRKTSTFRVPRVREGRPR